MRFNLFIVLIFAGLSSFCNPVDSFKKEYCVKPSKVILTRDYGAVSDHVVCQWDFRFNKYIFVFEGSETPRNLPIFRDGVITAPSFIKAYFAWYQYKFFRSTFFCSALVQRAKFVFHIYSVSLTSRNAYGFSEVEVRTYINCNMGMGGPFIFRLTLDKEVSDLKDVTKVKCYRFAGVQL